MLRGSRGFTLVELLVALVVVSILAAIGVPAFTGSFERTRADTDTGQLVRALNLARLEAINRSSNVSVQPVTPGAWAGSLDVLVEGQSTPLRRLDGMASGGTLAASGTPAAITFNNFGALETPAGSVTFTYSRGASNKTVSVCPTGRIQTGSGC
jgi:type IV fimbrial biogenesis protein FimU